MAADANTYQAYREALERNIGLDLRPFPSAEWTPLDKVSYGSNIMLEQAGAEDALYGRMTGQQLRQWRPSRLSVLRFDAELLTGLDATPDTQVALIATRLTPTRQLARVGLLAVVGYRPGGDSTRLVPIGEQTDVSFAANVVVGWRERSSDLN